MMKRFLSMIAILAISLLAACAQVPSHCKGCPAGSVDCCGACPCGEAAYTNEASSEKICDPSKAKKHHRKHHPKAVAAPAAVKDAKGTIPNQEKEKTGMFEGVKKIIKDVQSKDAKKPE